MLPSLQICKQIIIRQPTVPTNPVTNFENSRKFPDQFHSEPPTKSQNWNLSHLPEIPLVIPPIFSPYPQLNPPITAHWWLMLNIIPQKNQAYKIVLISINVINYKKKKLTMGYCPKAFSAYKIYKSSKFIYNKQEKNTYLVCLIIKFTQKCSRKGASRVFPKTLFLNVSGNSTSLPGKIRKIKIAPVRDSSNSPNLPA